MNGENWVKKEKMWGKRERKRKPTRKNVGEDCEWKLRYDYHNNINCMWTKVLRTETHSIRMNAIRMTYSIKMTYSIRMNGAEGREKYEAEDESRKNHGLNDPQTEKKGMQSMVWINHVHSWNWNRNQVWTEAFQAFQPPSSLPLFAPLHSVPCYPSILPILVGPVSQVNFSS